MKKLLLIAGVLFSPTIGYATTGVGERGLLTQAFGTQTLAAPGDVGQIVDPGGGNPTGFKRTVVGPSLAGWPVGWAAENNRHYAFQLWGIGASSSTANRGMISAWYFINHGAADQGSNGLGYLIQLRSHPANAESVFVQYDTASHQLSLFSLNARFTTLSNIKVLPDNRWVKLGLGYELSGSTASLRLLYRECTPGYFNSTGTITQGSCRATQTIATVDSYNQFGQVFNAAGTGWQWSNGALVNMRLGLPTLYTASAFSDITDFPTDIIDPPPGPNEWYVSAAATGGGLGYSPAQAWTGTEYSSFTSLGEFTVLGGTVTNPTTGALIDTTLINGNVLAASYKAGTAAPMGDRVNFDDTAGPIFLAQGTTAQSNISYSDNIRLEAIAGLGHKADIRGTYRFPSTDWTPVGSNVYVASITCASPVVFPFDNITDANSPDDYKTRISSHPAVPDLATYKTVATPGSFWSDESGGIATHVYIRPTGDLDPRVSGAVYEVSRQNNMIVLDQNGGLLKNLNLGYSMAVDASNTDVLSVGVEAKINNGDQMIVYDGDYFRYGGKHNVNVAENSQTHLRWIVLNSKINVGRPTGYVRFGGSTLEVVNQNTNGLDTQTYFENVSMPYNVVNEGSKTGTIDVNQQMLFEHNSGNANRPIKKAWFYNVYAPGPNTVGGITNDLVVDGCVFGSTDTNNGANFQSVTLAFTRNRYTGRLMPSFGTQNGNSLIRSNLLLIDGIQNNLSVSVGTVTLIGNTIDYSSATAGIPPNSIFTGNGSASSTTWNVVANNFIMPTTNDIAVNQIRLFDLSISTNGGAFYSYYNVFQSTSANRTLIQNYNGAPRSLAQMQAISIDTGSLSTSDLKLNLYSYTLQAGSPARNFANSSNMSTFNQSFNNTADFYGVLRPNSGFVDSGAILFIAGGGGGPGPMGGILSGGGGLLGSDSAIMGNLLRSN